MTTKEQKSFYTLSGKYPSINDSTLSVVFNETKMALPVTSEHVLDEL